MKKETKKQKIVLLDSHAILHRAYHALPDFASSKGEPTGALYGLSLMIISIIKEFKPDYIFAAFDLPKPTYRHEAYENYKAGRKKTDENLISQIKKSRELFKSFSIPIYEKEGYEADDVLGTLATDLKEKYDIIIASGDMDTMQLIDGKKVQVYTLKKGIKDLIIYDEDAVVVRYGFKPEFVADYKGLRGDPSDNIIGIAGIGEKTATMLIQEFGSVENIYKNIEDKKRFEKAGIKDSIWNLLNDNQEEALFSKMLATINCEVPVDFQIPEKTWNETVDLNAIRNLYRDLDFKTLISKVESLFGEVTKQAMDFSEPAPVVPAEEVDPVALEQSKVMLWLINSSITNPDLQDILNFSKKYKFEEAYKILEQRIVVDGLDFVYENIEKPVIQIVEKMNKNGVLIDQKFLQNLSEEYHVELSQYEKEIWEMTGEEFNINSSQQLSEILFQKMQIKYPGTKKTKGGKLSTNEEVLQKLVGENPVIEKILEYREIQKLLSTYIDNIPKLISDDGRLRATFVQTGTTTGRMSSNNPNLQNIPMGSERGQKIRKAFIASPKKVLISADYSQVELRIAAILSDDEKLINIFKTGLDVHTAVASEVFGVPIEEVTKEMRRQAKTINFGMLYGMGVNALKQSLKTDRKTAQEFYNKYFLVYSKLSEYLSNVKTETAVRGYTKTMFGRRRYFEGFKSALPYVRAQAERMAINAPIQGTSADLVKLAMVRINDFLVKEKLEDKIKLIMQIHDEVVYEVEEELEKMCREKIKEIMQAVLTEKENKGVPLLAEAGKGNNLYELK